MPYTASYTFSGSTVISATNAQSNLTDMKEYNNGGVSSSDLRTSDKWVESSHLVHGSYNPINNTMNFMSGVSGTNLAADGTESWMLDSPTARDEPATPVKVDYPDTGATFYLERAANHSSASYDARDLNWFQWSNFYLKEGASAGWHHARLIGYTTTRQAILLNWGMTIEAYYR